MADRFKPGDRVRHLNGGHLVEVVYALQSADRYVIACPLNWAPEIVSADELEPAPPEPQPASDVVEALRKLVAAIESLESHGYIATALGEPVWRHVKPTLRKASEALAAHDAQPDDCIPCSEKDEERK